MDLFMYNCSLEATGIIDTFKSLIWIRRYFQAGAFELYAPATPNNLALIKKYGLVVKDDGSDEVGYISSLQITEDKKNGIMIKASGKFLSGILDQRVILISPGNLGGAIDSNCISSAEIERNISNFIIDPNLPGIVYTNKVIGKKLGNLVEALARANNFGYYVSFDPVLKTMAFKVYYGKDRSALQSENPRVIFSPEYDNLQCSTYTNEDINVVNSTYGVCELPAGIEACIPPSYNVSGGSGLSRFEEYVVTPAETYDLVEQIVTETSTTSITKTYLDYPSTLENMKADSLGKMSPIQENFEGEVSFERGYKTLYDLGDIVTLYNPTWGISTHQRITEVTEIYDHKTNKITPVFGNPAKTIMDILKE